MGLKSFLVFFGILVLAVLLAAFIHDVFMLKSMTYNAVYKHLQDHCKQLHYNPCDYKLVRFEKDKDSQTGIFIFESAYKKPISIGIYDDGDMDLVDSNYDGRVQKNKP